MIRLEVTAATHVGCQRTRNEDRLVIGPFILGPAVAYPVDVSCPPFSPIICVLDGMGGHTGGDVAAQTAAEVMASADVPVSSDAVIALVEEANAAVYARAAALPMLSAMGTTIAGLSAAEDEILVFNAGDSRVYEVLDGYLLPRTADDAAPTGELTSCLGGRTKYQPVTLTVRTLAPTDSIRFVVATDGLFGHLDGTELEGRLAADRHETAQFLLGVALGAGGPDNVTLAVVDAIPATGEDFRGREREVSG